MGSKNTGIVYSTESGRMCPDCGRPKDRCVCPQKRKRSPGTGDGVVRVSRETAKLVGGIDTNSENPVLGGGYLPGG